MTNLQVFFFFMKTITLIVLFQRRSEFKFDNIKISCLTDGEAV